MMKKKTLINKLIDFGWNEPEVGLFEKNFNIFETEVTGDFSNYKTENLIDPLYILYRINVNGEKVEYTIYKGGDNIGNCIFEPDDYGEVTEAILKDDFMNWIYPPEFEVIYDSGFEMKGVFLDIVRATKDWENNFWKINRGDYFIEETNNTNVKFDEPTIYYPISVDEAIEILKSKDIYQAILDFLWERMD